ncbi:hypothetical protein Tco_0855420 [Tanacetum coccineum]
MLVVKGGGHRFWIVIPSGFQELEVRQAYLFLNKEPDEGVWKRIFKKRNKKKAKSKQIQARNGKDKVKSQPGGRKYNLRG